VDIAIPIYDKFAALDAVGPYEVLCRLPGAKVTFVADKPGPVQTETRMLSIVAEASIEDLARPEVIVVPGGYGNREMLEQSGLVDWIRTAHETTEWTTSVCTGSLLLAAAGVLDGVDAATHWLTRDELRDLGAVPVEERVVERGKVITAAGVSAGIDMALTLVSRITNDQVAQAIQLGIEYDPQPPFDAGSPAKAPEEIVELVTNLAKEYA
jgi:transcriptional regulator GlxA family with amidase domain